MFYTAVTPDVVDQHQMEVVTRDARWKDIVWELTNDDREISAEDRELYQDAINDMHQGRL